MHRVPACHRCSTANSSSRVVCRRDEHRAEHRAVPVAVLPNQHRTHPPHLTAPAQAERLPGTSTTAVRWDASIAFKKIGPTRFKSTILSKLHTRIQF